MTSRSEPQRLRALFDHLPAMVGYWDRDLHNVIANQAYVEWFGFGPEQMHGRHIREVLGEPLYALNLPYIERALAGEAQLFQRTIIDKQGVTRHTQASYVPEIVDGAVLGFFVLVTDVTPRVEAQRQMDEAQQLAELGSWTMVPATEQLTWSSQMYRILGQDPDVFTPTVDAVASQMHPDDRERVLAVAAQAVVSGAGYELHYRILRPDGEIREVHSRGRTDQASDGSVTRLTGTMQDVTSWNLLAREMSRANEQLQRVNQLNADVLGMVSHDVRQPLGLVIGHLELLEESWDESPEETRLDRLGKALEAARRLTALVDDILAMATLDSGTIVAHPVTVQVAELVRDALELVHRGSEVEVRGKGALALVDPFHLRQMVTNLVVNALRYGAPPVSVTIQERDGRVDVDVADHGEGVPPEFVPHLFERFARASTGVAAQKAGSGFGLYVVARLAEANGSRISHAAGSPCGAVFRLDLPAAPT